MNKSTKIALVIDNSFYSTMTTTTLV